MPESWLLVTLLCAFMCLFEEVFTGVKYPRQSRGFTSGVITENEKSAFLVTHIGEIASHLGYHIIIEDGKNLKERERLFKIDR